MLTMVQGRDDLILVMFRIPGGLCPFDLPNISCPDKCIPQTNCWRQVRNTV